MSPGWSWVNRMGNPNDTLVILNSMWSLSKARKKMPVYQAEPQVRMNP